ncbi:hypothetical protein D3C76_1545030 [compost metagenome]
MFAIRRLQHGDQARIEAEEAKVTLIFHVDDFRQTIVLEIEASVDLAFFAIREIKRAAQHLDAVGLHGKLPRPGHAADLAILHPLQQGDHFLFAIRHARLKVNHAAIHRRR